MYREEFKELLASIILIGSLLCFCAWKFIPDDCVFTYLYFDNYNWSFSLNPLEYRTYSLAVVWPHLLQYTMPVMYISLMRLLPKMNIGVFDLWWFYWIWELYKALNQILAFGQFPYIRYVFILGLLYGQIAFLMRKR